LPHTPYFKRQLFHHLLLIILLLLAVEVEIPVVAALAVFYLDQQPL
jgi:hypothetical protein